MEDGILREAVVDSFMDVTACDSRSAAERHLAFCGWQLEAAINRYFTTGLADPAPDAPVAARSETMHDDTVRDPIPARSAALYGNANLYAAGSSTARAAPSIWSADRARPSPWSVQRPAPMAYTSMPDIPATGWESDGDTAPVAARSETVPDGRVRDPIPATLYGNGNFYADRAPPSPWSVDRPAPMEYTFIPDMTATGCGSDGDTGSKETEEINMSGHDEQMKVAEEDNRQEDKVAMEEEYDYGDMQAEDEYHGTESDDDGAYLEAAETDSNDGRMEALEGQPGQTEKTLEELFRPPYEIMFGGSFHNAKAHAASKDRWLLVNLQSSGDFKSQQHNRDLWSNEVVVQVIKDNFIFLLLEKRGREGDEGLKVCSYYSVHHDQLPAVLVLDPVTGQLLDKWCGLVQQPDDFLTSIGKFTESKPSLMSKPKIVRRTATLESGETPAAQEPATAMPNTAASDAQPAPAPKVDEVEAAPAPKVEEIKAPAVDDGQPMEGETVCKLRVRFPAGNMVTKEFGSTRKIAVLFAYCRSVVVEQTGKEQAFRIMRLAGQNFEELLDVGASFDDLKLSRDTISVVLH
uniref:UBX domain-containing protein n=1 Tax=Triticum urartu TaxID=4572 RepID=A0A8R7QPD4_TRIUA